MSVQFTEKIKRTTAFENCLSPLLSALNWRGGARTLKEAMPHYENIITKTQFIDVMSHLNFEAQSLELKPEEVDERLLPCLLLSSTGNVMVLLSKEGDKFEVYDGVLDANRVINLEQIILVSEKIELYVFKERLTRKEPVQRVSWLKNVYKNNKGLIYNALFLSLVLNLLIFSVSIYIISVYDSVIGASSYSMLGEFSVGVLLAVIGVYMIYKLRASHLSLLGARIDKMVGNRIIAQLLYLSPSFTEAATAGAQVARIKDFDRVRESLSGPLLTVFFDLPFIVVALALIAWLAGNLVFVPIVMLIIYVASSLIISFRTRKAINKSAKSFADLQELLIESVDNLRVIKYTASVKKWGERYRDVSAKASLTNIRFAMYNAINVSFSEFIMMGSGVLIMAFGAIKAMNETLGIGALLGIMILTWRVLTPVRRIFDTLPRVLQMINSYRQINRLMNLAPESDQLSRVKLGKINFKGDIKFKAVSMRYPGAYTPSFLGVSLHANPGEIVAVVGRNGSGKSTLLKILLGLYQAQAGSVLLDNIDIRQYNPLDLRSSIGYLPQTPELFYGTIADNLRLGDPAVSEQEFRIAANKAGILEQIIAMPQGFDTRLTDQSTQTLASSFKQSLCIARAYLRNSKILLLDEPGNSLDMKADKHLIEHLKSIKGKVTVIMVTHRPSHLAITDQIILLEQGQVALHGKTSDILEKIPLEYL